MLDTDIQVNILLIRWGVILHPISFSILIAFIGLLLFSFSSILISLSESAFFSLSPAEKDRVHTCENRKERIIHRLLSDPQHLLASLSFANNIVNVALLLTLAYISYYYFGYVNHPLLLVLFQMLVFGFLILFCCKLLPKVYAMNHPYKVVLFMAYPVYFTDLLLRPFHYIILRYTTLISHRLIKYNDLLSINELSDALEIKSPSLSDERKILKGIVKFGNIDVVEIMKSRIDVFAVEIDTPFPQLIDAIIESQYSRIPVYQENFDHINGILYVKDLLPFLKKGAAFQWQTLVRPPYYVPETKKINDLLKEFQTSKIHMAIVIDEYGGSSGIVTLEDILEEIVGEIIDEFDEDERMFTKFDEQTYIFDGKILLNDVYKILNIPDDSFEEIKGDADTLAGLILEIKGDMPEKNETIRFKQFTFKIEVVDNRRIKLIRVRVEEPMHNEKN